MADERGTFSSEGSDHDRRAPWWLPLIVGAVLVVFAVGTVQIVVARSTLRRSESTLRRLDQASMGVCQRLQLQRERSNLSDARQYLILFNASRNPMTPLRIRHRYALLADTTEYGPPTDCEQAVENPPHYTAPGFVPFSGLGPRFARELVHAAQQHKPPPVP